MNKSMIVVLLFVLAGCASEIDRVLPKAESGSLEDQIKLAELYLGADEGLDGRKKAAFWYSKAAEQGSPKAQYMMSRLHYLDSVSLDESSGELREGTKESEALALKWAKRAADQGYAPAIALLAEYYLEGVGTEISQDRAFRILSDAENSNDPAVLYQLGMLYLDGKGVVQDSRKGFRLIENSSLNGYSRADFTYCYLFDEGVHVKFDPEKSFSCYLRAAKADPVFGSDLANRYAFGRGIAQDSVLAYAWYLVSERHSDTPMHENDRYKMDIVEKRLNLFDRVEADLLASAWDPGESIRRLR